MSVCKHNAIKSDCLQCFEAKMRKQIAEEIRDAYGNCMGVTLNVANECARIALGKKGKS